MLPFPIILVIVLASIFVLVLTVSFGCFLKVFYSPRRRPVGADDYPIPEGEIYEAHREQMVAWMKEIRAMERRDVFVTSFDGLTLHGTYYEYQKGAPIEIMFHGYRGTAERDLCGGVHRCFALGHSALIVDHRAAGESEGRVITFGERERLDCLSWIDFTISEIDPDAWIILTGISMGAATVMLAASMELPENVVGVLADCGYTSTRAIVKKVIRDMHLPPAPLYPFVRLGALLFGHFDPDAHAPIESMKRCRLPVILFHGDTDDFVPMEMSEENYAACASEHKRLVIIHGAGHGLAFPVDQEGYLRAARDFFAPMT